MSDKRSRTPTDSNQDMIYQIRIKGQIDRQWVDWFDGMTITPQDNGDTLLTGAVVDQSALHGLLRKVRDLGMPLVSINRVAQDDLDSTVNHKPNKV